MLNNILILIERNLKLRVLPFMNRKYFIFFIAGCLMIQIAAQAQNIPNTATKLSGATVVSENSVQTQKTFWKSEIKLNPKNAEAWLQLYQWTERDKSLQLIQKQLLLEEIRVDAEKQISASWANYLINYLHTGMTDAVSLKKAIAISDNDAIIMPYAIQYAIIQNDSVMQKLYGERLQKAAPLSNSLFQFHLNCLLSADSNATIYAKGLNDLVPLSMLQQVFEIRKDIKLRYYNHKIKPHKNTYLCLTLGQDIIKLYPNAMYTGLLIKLLPDENTLVELEHNIDKQFGSTTLNMLSKLLPEEELIYRNYLPGLITLYNKYKKTDEVKMKKYASWISRLAEQTHATSIVQKILAQ